MLELHHVSINILIKHLTYKCLCISFFSNKTQNKAVYGELMEIKLKTTYEHVISCF